MKNVFIFLSGAAIGGVVTWKLIEKHYKDLADEEIESVIEAFRKRENEEKKKVKPDKEEIKETVTKVLKKKKKKENNDVNEIIIEEGYSKEEKDPIIPYVITPEQFGEFGEYGTKTLTYYADDVLTDEIDVPISGSDMVTMLGPDALDHFGEYEDDSVYIRDEENEMDYEILKTEKLFSEIPRGRVD